MVVVWLVCPSLPGPSPQPSPVQRERGMFVADEGVAAVRGVWLFGWCAPPSPGIPRSHSFARSRPFRCAKGARVVLVQRVGGEGVCWWFG